MKTTLYTYIHIAIEKIYCNTVVRVCRILLLFVEKKKGLFIMIVLRSLRRSYLEWVIRLLRLRLLLYFFSRQKKLFYLWRRRNLLNRYVRHASSTAIIIGREKWNKKNNNSSDLSRWRENRRRKRPEYSKESRVFLENNLSDDQTHKNVGIYKCTSLKIFMKCHSLRVYINLLFRNFRNETGWPFKIILIDGII